MDITKLKMISLFIKNLWYLDKSTKDVSKKSKET